ncbi:hypothetical protein BXZ70DRAFT_910605 [Cristinia sonorae]|uniref:Uncharacterized protein n=1 Tax=Cristinia sonorae TaxID=1940300 RepID=A0A8K0UHE1_9AGAR|nr:hypothetical protein BXZ70DRAFT_910605 [Cristinia sonorae]
MRFTASLLAVAALIVAVAANPIPCGPNAPPVDVTNPAFDKRQCGVEHNLMKLEKHFEKEGPRIQAGWTGNTVTVCWQSSTIDVNNAFGRHHVLRAPVLAIGQ